MTGSGARSAWDGALRAAGVLLLASPLIPIEVLFGEVGRARGYVPPGEWLLALFIFGTAAWLLARFLPEPAARVERLAGRTGATKRDATFLLLCLALLAGLLLVTSRFAFAHRPLLIDSVVQLFQAKIFASGRLAAPAPPGEAFFATQHMLVHGGRWYSQYPPGHSAVLALGVLLGRPWLVSILLSLGTAALLASFAGRIYDRSTGRLTLVMLILAPFFWFMGASHMNHVSALFFVALFLRLFVGWEGSGRVLPLFLSGAALGAALLSRPLEAVAVGLVFGGVALRMAGRRGWLRSLPAGALGAAIPAALYLAYNAATTGDPFLPGYLQLWGESHGLGFHATPWGEVHTVGTGLRNELLDLALLNTYLFEWPIPALLPIGALFAAGWATAAWDRRLLIGFLAVPAAYFFYWHRDAFLGPRYLYSGLAFLVPLTARSVVVGYRRLEDRQLWSRSALTRVPLRNLLTALLILSVGYAALYAVPRRFQVYRSGLASMKRDLAREAAAAGLRNALVFTPVSWGNRLIARARGLGVSASLAETTYRSADHCDLEVTLRRAETEGWDAETVETALARLPSAGTNLPLLDLNGDPTLRLANPAALPPACADEILYDIQGYGNFSPHLADNDPDLAGPVVFARDLRGRNAELRARFPGRRAYLARPGRLLPLD